MIKRNRKKLTAIEWFENRIAVMPESETKEMFCVAISALKKQEQSCETCKHGKFGDEACINCRVGFPNHYEVEEES